MLQSIRLTMQSHKDTLVEFDPGVNYIIGRSRQGKTAILRALVKVIQNRPIQGIERWVHKHNPKNISKAEVTTTDDHSVTWEGTIPQRYIVDGEELSGFGQGVPQAVTDALRLGELNIAGQHDRPFLLFDTPGEVARTLNRVVRLDVIDRVLANHASIRRKNGQEIQVNESRIKELTEQQARFPDLEAGAAKLESLEAKHKEQEIKAWKITGLGSVQRQLMEIRAGLESLRVPDGVGEGLDQLQDTQSELEVKSIKFHGLRRLNSDITAYSHRLGMLKPGLAQGPMIINLLAKLTELGSKATRFTGIRTVQKSLDLLMVRKEYLARGLKQDPWISEALTRQAHLQAKGRHLARLLDLNKQIDGAKLGVNRKLAIIIAAEKQIKAEFGDRCPLCGAGIKQ